MNEICSDASFNKTFRCFKLSHTFPVAFAETRLKIILISIHFRRLAPAVRSKAFQAPQN